MWCIDWLPLYSIWADWPQVVKKYRKKWAENWWPKPFNFPTRNDAKTVEVVYIHVGSVEKLVDALFNVVYNNGFTMTELNAMSYLEVQAEAPQKLAAYLHQEVSYLREQRATNADE